MFRKRYKHCEDPGVLSKNYWNGDVKSQHAAVGGESCARFRLTHMDHKQHHSQQGEQFPWKQSIPPVPAVSMETAGGAGAVRVFLSLTTPTPTGFAWII